MRAVDLVDAASVLLNSVDHTYGRELTALKGIGLALTSIAESLDTIAQSIGDRGGIHNDRDIPKS